MVSDLQADNNRTYRLLKQFSKESVAVTIASISLVVSVLFAIMAIVAMRDANQATAKAENWQQMYKETERECRLAQLEIDDFKMTMIRAGLDVPHEGESP